MPFYKEKTVPRKIIKTDEMKLVTEGDWLNLWRLRTDSNPRAEIVARRNGKWLGAKCLALYVGDAGIESTKSTTLNSFVHNIRSARAPVMVRFLAVDRPLTYFSFPDGANLKHNWQYEIPGGVVNPDEEQRHAGLRETLEESGLRPGGRVLQTTTLLGLPFATDSGGQVEMYSYEAAILQGEPKTVAREGIHPEECRMIQLPDAVGFLLAAQKNGILIEGHALTSLLLLERAMRM